MNSDDGKFPDPREPLRSCRISLAIPLQVEKMSSSVLRQQLARSLGPLAPGKELAALAGVRPSATEMGDQPSTQWALRSLRVVVVVDVVVTFNADRWL